MLGLLKGNKSYDSGPEYRKAIAEVVTRDFNLEISELKASSAQAKNTYIQGLGEI